jgi:NADP-dependent 3-hydroxy acid dehydrogenase YdfG
VFDVVVVVVELVLVVVELVVDLIVVDNSSSVVVITSTSGMVVVSTGTEYVGSKMLVVVSARDGRTVGEKTVVVSGLATSSAGW